MTAQYFRYVTTYQGQTIPAWSNTWPGTDGCGSYRTLSLTATPISAPPGNSGPSTYGQADYLISPAKLRNSGLRRGVPPYRFTDYQTGFVKYKEQLVRTNWATTGVNVWYQYGKCSGAQCTPTETSRSCTGPQYSTYYEQSSAYDFSFYQLYERSRLNEADVRVQLESVQNELLAEASTSYDALTDLAEIRDIPGTVTQITKDLTEILSTLKGRHTRDVLRRARSIRPKDLLKHPNKMLRRFGGEWMNYRYGIMPLVYSYRDIMKLMSQGKGTWTRKHRIVSPQATGQTLPSSGSTYRVADVNGKVVVRGEVFQWFTSSEISRLSSVGMNPLVTAWELIPYSFVFDWFVDIGGYIAAATSSNWAQTKFACLSRRDSYTETVSVHLPNRDKTITIVNKTPTNWLGANPPATPNVIISNPAGDYPLYMKTVETYRRWNISFTPVTPVWNPSLNWRRLIDGAYLVLSNLGSLLKRL